MAATPGEAAPPAQAAIKGNILLARQKYVRDRGGEKAWSQVLARLPEDDRKTLSRSLMPVTWYPMELGLRLDEAIAQIFSPGQPDAVFLDMGRASAEVNLAGAEKVFMRPGDPQYLLKMAPQVYGFYYQAGRRTYEKTGPTSGVLRTFDADCVTWTDCLTVMGWYIRGLELSGAREVTANHPVCRVKAGAHCEYHFAWSPVG